MPDNIQVPQLTPEQQAEKQAFLRKKQIFLHAILQAMSNGMKSFEGCDETQFEYLVKSLQTTAPTVMDMTPIDYMIKNGGYVTLVMSHDFAKVFFGTHMVDQNGQPQQNGIYIAWQFHLMQLAITPDKFEYLASFLKPLGQQQEWR